MKTRYIGLLLVAAILASLLVLPVGAAETMRIAADTVSGKPGETVTLTLSVEGNPGMAYINVSLKYDKELFAKETVTNGNVFDNAPTDALNTVWNQGGGDVTADGVLGTYTFTIDPEAAPGTYEIEVLVNECYNTAEEAVTATAVKGAIVVVDDTPVSTITKSQVTLGADITVNYYAQLDEQHTGAEMRFTMNGKEKTVCGLPTEEAGVYVFSFEEVAPQCMGDEIKAELMLEESVLDVDEGFSVKGYCRRLLTMSAEELGLNAEQYALLPTLVADLLEYGAQAQLYRNYRTNALVNEGVVGKSDFAELSAYDWEMELGATNVDGTQLIAAGVHFSNVNRLYFRFTAPNITETSFSVKVMNTETGDTVTYVLSEFEEVPGQADTYTVYSEPIMATQFGHYFTVQLLNQRGRAIQTLSYYSINAYVLSKQNQTDAEGDLTKMANLARATYLYGASASLYAAA